jgi:hypothetical protein
LFKAIFRRPKDLCDELETYCESINDTNNVISNNIFSGEVNQLLTMSPRTRGRHLEVSESEVMQPSNNHNTTIPNNTASVRKLKGDYANDALSHSRHRLFSALRKPNPQPVQDTSQRNTRSLSI